MGFKKTAVQYAAIELMKNHVEVLLEGGSRSGKTFIEIYAMISRGVRNTGTRHIALRKHFNHAKLTLWSQTIPEVFKIAFPEVAYKENKTDYFIDFAGSQLWIGGTDDKERIEKILGSEWATMFFNEVSQMPYSTYETLKTRLNPPKGMRPLLLLDQNPPSSSHWSFKRFHAGVNPENGQTLSEKDKLRQCFFKMNPADNVVNLSEGYIDILESMSESKKRRFLYGEYGDDSENALWKREWIVKNRIKARPASIIRLVVAIDPNVTDDKKVTNSTDEAGIITVGRYKIVNDFHYAVIRDDSMPGLSWGEVGCRVYREEKADKIIGEVNQGGDLIEMNLRNYDKTISYDSVRATRGKEVRAEPIADLYRRGFVHHLGEFPELEDELTTWTPGEGRSPNRLDALVWGISYLAGIHHGSINKTLGW